MNKLDTPLNRILKKRNLTLRDLYIKLKGKIRISRLSDIRIAREIITQEEIQIIKDCLNLEDEEIEQLEDMELDKWLIEASDKIGNILKLVPKDLKAGQEVIKICPNCGRNLRIARATLNGHLWIVCEKEGVILCE